ncbi:MAG: hypothetical protein AAGC91_11225 [Pseudomonadota bacterium]
MNLARLTQLVMLVALAALLPAIAAFSETSEKALPVTNAHRMPNTSPEISHAHRPIEVPADAPAPTLSLDLRGDAISGINLILRTQNFVFTVPSATTAPEPGIEPRSAVDETNLSGHAHLYINGVKIMRVYGNAVHVPEEQLRNGINQLSVSLNDHSHRQWSRGQRPILATLFVYRSSTGFELVHRFESFPSGTPTVLLELGHFTADLLTRKHAF